LRALVKAGRLCGELGMRVNFSCKTGESSVACAAALHAASVMPDLAWGLTLTHGGIADDVTAEPLPITRGFVECLERPGLGIEVEEQRLRHHQVDTPTRNVA
jgi:L-alanine-DL-glutamate epimerase-like enolase superfamily enzyme